MMIKNNLYNNNLWFINIGVLILDFFRSRKDSILIQSTLPEFNIHFWIYREAEATACKIVIMTTVTDLKHTRFSLYCLHAQAQYSYVKKIEKSLNSLSRFLIQRCYKLSS